MVTNRSKHRAPGEILKVALGEGEELPVVTGSMQLDGLAEQYPDSSMIDPSTGTACFAVSGDFMLMTPGRIIKVSLGAGSVPPERISFLEGFYADSRILTSAIDVEHRCAYFGESGGGVDLAEVSLGDSMSPPAFIAQLPGTGEEWMDAVIDAAGQYLFMSANVFPPAIVKYALGEGSEPLRKIGAVILNPGYSERSCLEIDSRGGHLYYAIEANPVPFIAKIDPGEGDELPSVIGEGLLNLGDFQYPVSVIDSVNGYMYIGSDSGKIIKVFLGEGEDIPVRIGELALPVGSATFAAVVDSVAGYGYFSGSNPQGKSEIIKVELGTGDLLPEIVGTVLIPDSDTEFFGYGDIDRESGYAMFASHRRLVKIRLGESGASPEIAGELLQESPSYPSTALLDTKLGFAYIGSGYQPGIIDRAAMSNAGFIKGSKATMPQSGFIQSISVYSHQAAGNLRAAIYSADSAASLLWESPVIPNTVDDGWIEIPISDGEPSGLSLGAGDYWLAIQTDSTADVLSHTAGQYGEGVSIPWNWGSFAGSLGPDALITEDRWSIFLRYDETSFTPTPTSPPTATPTVHTPTPTPTPEPECTKMRCTVLMPAETYTAGDECRCDVKVCNTTGETLQDVPVFVILDVYGLYFFAPSFGTFDFYSAAIPPGASYINVLETFSWPEGAGTASNIRWYAAMTDPAITTLIGDMGMFTFGWY